MNSIMHSAYGDRCGARFCAAILRLIGIAAGAFALGQSTPSPIVVKAIAEVELRTNENGRETIKLVPAGRVVSGDWVSYTLEARNTAPVTLPSPTVTYPVPEHMWYAADSAIGPGAEVSYSVDGGRHFDVPENLTIQGPDGSSRPATAADYTNIQWQLKNALKANSVAFVRFRARAK
jgi:hypothetical protein